MSFPPLYECSECGEPVKVTPVEGSEPVIKRKCNHDAVIWANRKVTLYGKGAVGFHTRWQRKIKLTVRQLLSAITGRSI